MLIKEGIAVPALILLAVNALTVYCQPRCVITHYSVEKGLPEEWSSEAGVMCLG
jgi:hypothetical protein